MSTERRKPVRVEFDCAYKECVYPHCQTDESVNYPCCVASLAQARAAVPMKFVPVQKWKKANR